MKTKLRNVLSAGAIALTMTVGAVTLPAFEAKAAPDTTDAADVDTNEDDGAWDWLGLLGLIGLAGLAGKNKRHDYDTTTTSYREPSVSTSRDPNRPNY